MTVVKLANRRLVIFSAIALGELEMSELEAHGEPSFMIVPNGYHCRDAKIWKDRYPAMQVAAPMGARRRVERTVRVDTTEPDFADRCACFVTVAGTRQSEAALLVNTPTGTTLVLNDLIANIRDEFGFSGWLLRRMGLAGEEAKLPMSVRAIIISEKSALREQLLSWAAIESLNRVLMSHGAMVDTDARSGLRRLAASLR
jgi:hypothetical protein